MQNKNLDVMIRGFAAPGFDPVREAFTKNFTDDCELGAAFAVAREGVLLVDLWGGVANRTTGAPWNQDTLQLIFSGTKGLVATCILILLDRREIRLEAPVTEYWSEFGKDSILVRDIVSHRARLPGLQAPVTVEDLTADRRMAALLAEQSPCEDPRALNCYHPLTFGWLCGELVRRVSGRSIGQFFHEEVALPLGLDLWIGLPNAMESRTSHLELSKDWDVAPFLDPAVWARDPLVHSVWANPAHFTAETFPWNQRPHHTAEIAGVNAIGTARSVAALYGCLACGGSPILSQKAVLIGRAPLADGFDDVHRVRRRTGVGFQLQTELQHLGPPPQAFGHNGAGGSNHGAWPKERIGYSYCMNLMRDDTAGDQRALRLLKSLHEVLRFGC